MIRVIAAAALGAMILFVWGMISWMLLPWHTETLGQLPDEDRVVAALRDTGTASGVYWIPGSEAPGPDLTDEQNTAWEEAWMEKHRAGPLAMLVYNAEGREPMAVNVFINGLGMNLVAALIAAMLLASAGRLTSYVGRVAFVAMLETFGCV